MTLNTVDVIVPTRNRGALIQDMLAGICVSTHRDFTLWLVDQSDNDDTANAVAPFRNSDPRVRYLRTVPRGSSAARNVGIAAGNAPYIIFTDDDCIVAPNWLENMARELAHEQAWAVFGQVVPDDYEFMAQAFPPNPTVDPAITLAAKKSHIRRVYQGNRLNLGFGHGANMGFNRARLETIGGFDELLGAGGKFRSFPERDIGYRILARGGKIIYTPEALVHHRHWRDWEGVRRTYRNYAFGAGAASIKYLRCGDWGGAYIFFEWIIDQGARQVLSGLLKWRSRQKIEIGWTQMIYPWVGLAHGLRQPIDHTLKLYRND